MGDDLAKLAADLRALAASALDDADKIAKRGAQNLKTDYAREASESAHFSSVAPAWSYEVRRGVASVHYDVGPDKDRAGGALANIYYFGSPRGGGGTGDIAGPLDREVPRTMKAFLERLGGLL